MIAFVDRCFLLVLLMMLVGDGCGGGGGGVFCGSVVGVGVGVYGMLVLFVGHDLAASRLCAQVLACCVAPPQFFFFCRFFEQVPDWKHLYLSCLLYTSPSPRD